MKESSLRLKLTITEKVESKIRWWCSKLPDNEWSGVLFYNYKGSFKKGNISFTAVDFLVLDIGTSGHTEFTEDERIISYACSQGLVNQQVALIHSHNRMNAFFSGEDTQTLIKEGSIRNHFLSLIVNNKGEYVAAITRRVKIMSSKIVAEYKTFNDALVSKAENNAVIDGFIERINLDIIMPENDNNEIFDELMDNKVTPITSNNAVTGRNDRVDDYPTLFDGKHDIVCKDNVMRAYNRIVTGSFGLAQCETALEFDRSLDEVVVNDEDIIYEFISGVINGLSTKEIERLERMLDKIDDSAYIDMCLRCINDNIEFYER